MTRCTRTTTQLGIARFSVREYVVGPDDDDDDEPESVAGPNDEDDENEDSDSDVAILAELERS